jgi:hypothetical protein
VIIPLLMTRRPEPNEDEEQALLRSLMDVGSCKPVGYLPLYTIQKFLNRTPEAVAAAAAARGLATVQFAPTACCIKSGALFVYHREALAALLQARANSVRDAGLPLDPDIFVTHIAAVWFDQDHPAYPIIAAAFGDGD